jgi:hypothetical protein
VDKPFFEDTALDSGSTLVRVTAIRQTLSPLILHDLRRPRQRTGHILATSRAKSKTHLCPKLSWYEVCPRQNIRNPALGFD